MIEFKIDCSSVNSEKDLHLELKKKLDFPSFYGENLDALNDSLTEFIANYTNHMNPLEMNHLVFIFINFEHAVCKISEKNFQLFLKVFSRAINHWEGTVEAEVRLEK